MMLTQEELKQNLHYDPDTGIFTWIVNRRRVKSGDTAGYNHPKGYIYINHRKKIYLAHRLCWFYMTGSFPTNQIDHINGIRYDNRFINLREATNAENGANSVVQGKVPYKGVNMVGKKYRANIRKNYKLIYLGLFDTPEEAHKAYCKAAIELHGQFAMVK